MCRPPPNSTGPSPLLPHTTLCRSMFRLSTMGTVNSQSTVTVYMVLLGIGLGLTMQTLVLATQNAVPISDLGAATAAVSFFRSLGGSIGVALFGALFNSRLAERLDGLTVSEIGRAHV